MAEHDNISVVDQIRDNAFHKTKERKARKAIIWRIVYTLITIVVLIIFVTICAAVFFNIKSVEVSGSALYDADLIIEFSGIQIGNNMFLINDGVIEKRIAANYPYIKDVNIKRKLPDTIEINIIEDSPKYYTEIIGEYFILSADLKVLERTETINRISEIKSVYKLIELDTTSILYAVVGKELVFKRVNDYNYTLTLIENIAATDMFDTISKISYTEKYNIYFIYDGNYKIVIGDNTDILTKVSFAAQIIEKQTGEEGVRRRATVNVTDIGIGSIIDDDQLVLE
jgi:cell division protein FtsQ